LVLELLQKIHDFIKEWHSFNYAVEKRNAGIETVLIRLEEDVFGGIEIQKQEYENATKEGRVFPPPIEYLKAIGKAK
jgi:hypothetical protein